jgi:glycosyltransferase involved in cell wall biosynthesis
MVAKSGRHRLLFLSPVVPAESGNGLAMRVGFFLQSYFKLFDIDLAVFSIVATPPGSHDFARRHAKRMAVFPHPGFDTHFALIAAVDEPAAQLEAFRQFKRPSLTGFAFETAYRALSDWTRGAQYDAVHVSRLYLAEIALRWTQASKTHRPPLVLDCDEDDARTYRRMAALESAQGQYRRAMWAEAEADGFARLAQATLPCFDLTFVASNDEAASLSAWSERIVTIPNLPPMGIVRRRGALNNEVKTVLFVGSMGYAPNEDAARWMIVRVWPQLRRACNVPLRLFVVGSDPSSALRRLAGRPDITVTGTVRNVGDFYRKADLAVIPLRVGSGTRIKLLEGAAWGVPIVSTTLGTEGTTFRHRRDLLVADDAPQFARSCAKLLLSRTYAHSLAALARQRIAMDYDRVRWSRCAVERVAALVAEDRADNQ